jgi:hypothetical protein
VARLHLLLRWRLPRGLQVLQLLVGWPHPHLDILVSWMMQ